MGRERLYNFIRKNAPTLATLGLGFLSLGLDRYLPAGTFLERLVDHFSIAFFISAIVLFYWENGSKESKIHGSLTTLNQLIMNAAGESVNSVLKKRFRDESGNCPDYLATSRGHIAALINKILELQYKKIETSGGKKIDLWAKDKYIGFINYLLKDVVLRNVNNLVEIGNIGAKTFHVPSPQLVADIILAAQMSAMEKTNMYNVISDLTSWQNNQLPEFHGVTKDRVGDGVVIRRVFNVLHLERALDRMVTYADDDERVNALRGILEQHLRDSQEWGSKSDGEPRYDIKIIGKDELESSKFRTYLKERRIDEAHFGLFDHGEGVVRFTVTLPDLSDMSLSTDLDIIEADRSVFHAVWDHASTAFTEEQLGRIVTELERIVDARRSR